MSESAANEFTPLLLTEEEQTTQSTTTTPTTSKTQNYQTQESSTSTQDHAVTYASESTQQQSSNTQGGQRGNNGGLFGRRTNDTAVSSTLGDGKYDKHEIVRHRSRLASYPVLPEPEEIKKGYEAAAHALGIDRLLQAAADSMGGEDGVDGSHGGAKPDSKYMVVGTVRFWFVFITIMLSYFVACFDITLMASTHPVITSYFNASNEASWLTTAFMITNTGFQPLWGRLSDTIGRKSVYMIVLTIFALTNLWCGLANSIGSFIAARAICGIGAGGSMSMGLVITNDLVKIEHRGTYISYINVAFGAGAACGAAFGGVIADNIGWRWAFGIQVPILVICGAAAIFTVPNRLGPMLIEKKDSSGENPAWIALKNFDHLGLGTLIFAVAFLILFFNMGGNELPWTHPVIIVFLVLGVLLSALTLWVEKRAKQPIMPLHLLYNSPHMNLTYANLLASIASNTVLFNAPLWFQAVELETPSASGLRLAAPAIGGAIAGVLTGNIITWTRRLKPMLVVGSVVYLAGSIAIFFIERSMNEASKIALITFTPLSQGFIYPASMMSAFAVSSQDDQGVVTTTLSLWRNLGIVLGVAISSLVFQNMLVVYLKENVKGPDAEAIIEIARSSVRAIITLPDMYRDQVIDSYAMALKLSFITAIVASVLLLLLMLPMKLPKLKKGEQVNAGPGE